MFANASIYHFLGVFLFPGVYSGSEWLFLGCSGAFLAARCLSSLTSYHWEVAGT